MKMRPHQLDMLSAAGRHVADAEHLHTARRYRSGDQAWHLAGFCPECLRKACLEDQALYKALGHDLGPDAERLLEAGIALDPHAHRYGLSG